MPIRRDSVALPVIFQPIPRKKATAIWNKARRLDMKTSRKGRHGGMVGRSALTVLSVLIFDFLDYATGRLDPSHAAIARKARMCERSVQNALNRLRSLGILNWLRRFHKEYGPWGVRHQKGKNALPHPQPPDSPKSRPPATAAARVGCGPAPARAADAGRGGY